MRIMKEKVKGAVLVMNEKVKKLLAGEGENYILPFFWQHGEDEATLRKYMRVIHEANIGAVCIESRPHPDFLGDKWWADMDAILDEAEKLGMKVWILDDSHFPTGFANGAMKGSSDAHARKSIVRQEIPLAGSGEMTIDLKPYRKARPWQPTEIEKHTRQEAMTAYPGDAIEAIVLVREGASAREDIIDLSEQRDTDTLQVTVPAEGKWHLFVVNSTRNYGMHPDYINMMDPESVRVLLDTVYEPHYQHYGDRFGTTIAGFFSDEPELGNGHAFEQGKHLNDLDDLPWSPLLMDELTKKYGDRARAGLALLWEPGASPLTASFRLAYMDSVSRLVEKAFSQQIGTWCRKHGVQYIGHVIEDNNQHSRTGTSLGHYFRGLAGQDMAGVDDIGGQVEPQGDADRPGFFGSLRQGKFFQYTLAKLASSAAAIEPAKAGNSMCEIFGAYGWSEGVRLEKYLTDHFLVRGVNHFVPHAFSPKEFPDPDCPPHFYAHGHNPQYRHFGELMKYMNRVCELMSGGHAVVPAAILYMGESEWMCTDFDEVQEAAATLARKQIDFEILPADVFDKKNDYAVAKVSGRRLVVGSASYQALIVPRTKYISRTAAEGIQKLLAAGFPVFFAGEKPDAVIDEQGCGKADFPGAESVPLAKLPDILQEMELSDIRIAPVNSWIRYRHYVTDSDCYMFINEGTEKYTGKIVLSQTGKAYAYNAWDNRLETVDFENDPEAGTMTLSVTIEPLKSLFILIEPASNSGAASDKDSFEQGACTNPVKPLSDDLGCLPVRPLPECSDCLPVKPLSARLAGLSMQELIDGWTRSTCRAADYPAFENAKKIDLPDRLAEEEPKFSGFVRYERSLTIDDIPSEAILEISDAYEGVELFVNGQRLGIQIVPSYIWDIRPALVQGENNIRIEVATTLERESVDFFNPYAAVLGKTPEPTCLSGINGRVRVYFG